jgi:hypothetical protein
LGKDFGKSWYIGVQKSSPVEYPNPDIENCHCEGTEAFFDEIATHLFPLLAGLAMTEWEKGFVL